MDMTNQSIGRVLRDKKQVKLKILKNRMYGNINPCNEIFLSGSGGYSRLGMFGSVNKKLPLNKRVWKNWKGVKIQLGKMTRSHAQSCLQFCHQRRTWTKHVKDGYTYQEWVAMFFAKVMDPNTLE
jgi:hypothetical protein